MPLPARWSALLRRLNPGASSVPLPIRAWARTLRRLPAGEVPDFWCRIIEKEPPAVFVGLLRAVGGFSGMRLTLDDEGFPLAYRIVHMLFRCNHDEGIRALFADMPRGNRLINPRSADWVDVRWPTLTLAVQQKLWSLVPWLLERGASPATGDKSGYTPLHYAVAAAPDETWRLLLARSDPHASNDDGNTPAHLLARDTGFTDAAAAARARQRWKDLRAAGFSTSTCNGKGETAAAVLQKRGLPDFDALIARHEAAELAGHLDPAAAPSRARLRL